MAGHLTREDALRVRRAEAVLAGLPERVRVNLALKVMLGVEGRDAAGLLAFAGHEVSQRAAALLRADFERECG